MHPVSASAVVKILRDPLVVFLLIGGLLFLLYSQFSPQGEVAPVDPNRIEITNDIIEVLEAEWTARWNRPPTPDELKGLVDAYVKEEILFREATKLGLDKSDSIIRRRLAQKMEFLTSDISDMAEVSDETLAEYYETNSGSYARDAEFAFRHLFFSAENRENAETDASAILPLLNEGSLEFPQAVEKSDRTLLAQEYTLMAASNVGLQFGKSFAEGLEKFADTGDWIGPVKSGYGFHLVQITEHKPKTVPPLADIRDKVLADYRYEQREKLNENMLNVLLEQYDIIIAGEEQAPTTK